MNLKELISKLKDIEWEQADVGNTADSIIVKSSSMAGPFEEVTRIEYENGTVFID